MSRTTRRPKFYIKTSEIKELNRDIASAIRFPNHYMRVRMTEQELDTDYQRRLTAYEQSKKDARHSFWWYLANTETAAPCYKRDYEQMINPVPARRSKGYKRVAVEKSMDEVIADSKRDFATYTRDGKWNETSRNTGFKQAAAKCVRNANARFCSSVLRGEEHENTIYPHDHLGDELVWNFW